MSHLRAVDNGTPADDLDGAVILDQVEGFIRPYLALPSVHARVAIVLWTAHTYAAKEFYVTPRLILDSAEAGSGKTRVLELMALLVYKPELLLSPTTAAIFRMLADEEEPITLLFDETDAIFNAKTMGNYEDLRALLNAGYKRGATIPRCVGDASKMRVNRFKVFAPVVLAGIAGGMPKTITTRAVTIHMRKRARSEKVAQYRERDAEIAAKPIVLDLAAWVTSIRKELGEARPVMPEGVEDRPAEVWEALLAVADAAGGEWPARARAACTHFVLDAAEAPLSLGERLLGDIRDDVFTVWDSEGMPVKMRTGVATAQILARLTALEESPWADLYGKPLEAARLAKEMKRYQVFPSTFRDEFGKVVKGYETGPAKSRTGEQSLGLLDAWERHLPIQADRSGKTGNSGNSPGQSVTPPNPVTPTAVTEENAVTRLTCEVTDVTAVTPNTTGSGAGVHEGQLQVPGTPPPDPAPEPVPSRPRTARKPAKRKLPKQRCEHCKTSYTPLKLPSKYCRPACRQGALMKRKKES
ncbi:DUF3631 domain-containing protein [Nonomuraea sp. NPDC050153]|uniref:DUF3631 domain-containing protein n=1 Tax=Nonomuraea sp. NPDC050153 TaxID=3364359 RepID=UPI0037994E2B